MMARSTFNTNELSDSLNEFEEKESILLYETSRDREAYDAQANLYAIILATEHLERAYARDAIEQKVYSEQCKKLISQFRLAERVMRDQMSTKEFMAQYQMDCPLAVVRLLDMGVPEAVKGGTDEANNAVRVAETVQHFITTMDAVKLDQRAADELGPLLSDLMESLNHVPDTPKDFEPHVRVRKWVVKLNEMRAMDEISDEDSRQLYHDLDSAYTEFTRYLKRGATS